MEGLAGASFKVSVNLYKKRGLSPAGDTTFIAIRGICRQSDQKE